MYECNRCNSTLGWIGHKGIVDCLIFICWRIWCRIYVCTYYIYICKDECSLWRDFFILRQVKKMHLTGNHVIVFSCWQSTFASSSMSSSGRCTFIPYELSTWWCATSLCNLNGTLGLNSCACLNTQRNSAYQSLILIVNKIGFPGIFFKASLFSFFSNCLPLRLSYATVLERSSLLRPSLNWQTILYLLVWISGETFALQTSRCCFDSGTGKPFDN